MKNKLNILLIILGLSFIGISIYIGYITNFQGSDGFTLLMLGFAATSIGVIFTPKILETISNIFDTIVMLFSRP